jgi:hypothetical protein
MEYSFLVMRDEYRALQVQLHRWQSTLWLVPLWMHMQELTTAVPINSSRVYLKTNTYEFQVGSHIYFGADSKTFETFAVAAVGPNYVDISGVTTKAWGVGTLVAPARNGRLRESLTMSAITGDVVSGTIQVNMENTLSFDYNLGYTVDGFTYFDHEPNRASPISMQWQRDLALLDYGTGPISSYDLTGYTEVVRSYDYLSLGRSTASTVRTLLSQCRGMFKSFLLPNYQADMVPLAGPYASFDTSLYIKRINYTVDTFGRLTYPYLRIELKSGTVLLRKVVAASYLTLSSGYTTQTNQALRDNLGGNLTDSNGEIFYPFEATLSSFANTTLQDVSWATFTDSTGAVIYPAEAPILRPLVTDSTGTALLDANGVTMFSADLLTGNNPAIEAPTNEDAELLTLNAPFGENFQASDVCRISQVKVSRLDSDAVEFTWTTPNVVNMAISARGIQE